MFIGMIILIFLVVIISGAISFAQAMSREDIFDMDSDIDWEAIYKDSKKDAE